MMEKSVPRPHPVGSPYGFTPADWNTAIDRKSHSDVLYVVLGYQLESDHYDTPQLLRNVEAMFRRALEHYNRNSGSPPATLNFRGLGAAYGSHLFNPIARDIIASDIAVFDTSDFNPNVMLEMGVAITWGGMAVLPIREESCDPPPSDISGQTWAVYRNSAADFPAPEHRDRIGRMIEVALRTKRLKLSSADHD